jgi:hypothetical protein
MRALKWILVGAVLVLVVVPIVIGLVLWLWSGVVGG